MTKAALLAFMQANEYAVQASVSESGDPQAAVVGVIITEHFEVVFDTLASSRKARNLRERPRTALVIGGIDGGQRTVQYEGVAAMLPEVDRDRLIQRYLERFPDGVSRQEWPGLVYVHVRPAWIRYSDYGTDPPSITEFTADDLRRDAAGRG